MILCGIDYSITSPCMATINKFLREPALFKLENVEIVIVNTYLKRNIPQPFRDESVFKHIEILENNPKHEDAAFKYITTANQFQEALIKKGVNCAILEDYSFRSHGKNFNIGEATGLLKERLITLNIPFVSIPPTQIKKFATGKGNANKEKMYDEFCFRFGVDLETQFKVDKKHLSDIVDAVWILYFMYDESSGVEIEMKE